MADAVVLAVPAIHELAAGDEVSSAQLVGERFVSPPAHEGSVLADRPRRLAHSQRFVPHGLTAGEAGDHPDVHLRAAWRQDEPGPAVGAVLDMLLKLDELALAAAR